MDNTLLIDRNNKWLPDIISAIEKVPSFIAVG